MPAHDFTSRIEWTGNRGTGTSSYCAYDRNWMIATPGKPPVACSNDPLLGGDPTLHNPEDLLLASLSACHMLWFLHYASVAGIIVLSYTDDPLGHAESTPDGAGRFVGATLRPHIMLAPGSDRASADAIHGRIHQVCFIARSVDFSVDCAATYAEA